MPKISETAKIMNKGFIFALIVSTLSFFINIVPCTTSLRDFFNDGFCKIPNPFQDLSQPLSQNKFYFISSNPLTGLVMQFLVSAILFIAIYLYLKRKSFGKKKPKVVDFTKKRD
jgi:hypothetical protein